MNILFNETFSNSKRDYLSYQITNESEEDIGTVEGAGNDNGEFVSVVKIYNLKFQKKGLGFSSFKMVFDNINSNFPISIIKGSWHKDGEFKDFENGMSTNLLIFNENSKTMNDIDSAFSTPTGKWAKKLGFNNCQILLKSSDEVIVHFTK